MKIESLNLQQKHALRALMMTKDNLFLTGSAGTGKSFVIKMYREINKLSNLQIPLVASTGVASILINGVTFNSFFGLGIMHGGIAPTVAKASQSYNVCERIAYCDTIIVDEISMLSAETITAANLICQKVKNNKKFFGGIRMIFVGDFFQLGPFSSDDKKPIPWAFLSDTWRKGNIKTIELTEIMRTKETDFLNILAKVRVGNIDESVEKFLKSKIFKGNLDDFDGPRLFSTNKQVDDYNINKLNAINEPPCTYETQYVGEPHAINKLKDYLIINEKITLKKGALVMMRVNNFQDGYVNGTVGKVISCSTDTISIKTTDNRTIRVKKHIFELLNGDGDVIAKARNFPLTLAWAVTIHKSQGATFDKAIISLENLWLHGQAYTALSRLSSASNLYITGYNKNSFIVDKAVKKMFNIKD